MEADLIRPLRSRVADARMTLAASRVPPDPLTFSLSGAAQALDLQPPEVAEEVREQVLREALADGLTYHCDDERCPHIAQEGWVCASFLLGRIVCARCVMTRWEDGEPTEREPWQGTGDAPCTLCGGDGPLVSILTRTSHPDGIVYGPHVCWECARWWPRREPPEEEPSPPPANAGVTVTVVRDPRPVQHGAAEHV
jgi:hypothetical protein